MQLIPADILPYFGRCLKMLVDADWLPESPPKGTKLVVPKLNRHVITTSLEGQARCCRCLKLANGGACAGPCVPRGHRQHLLCSIGEGLFCGICGAYSFSRTRKLAQACGGHPVARSGTDVYLQRMLNGRHPVTRRDLGPPKDLWSGILDVLLGVEQ